MILRKYMEEIENHKNKLIMNFKYVTLLLNIKYTK